MRKFQISSAMVFLLLIVSIGGAAAQTGVSQLDPLVTTSARRLAIAQQVALSKWDSGAAVEDAPREAQVILGSVKAGEARGIDSALATKFFKAQIEANKVVQYSLLADWRRSGSAPAHAHIDLVGVIRPELDQVQTQLIAELADTTEMRSSANCQVAMADAVGKYLADHRKETSKLTEIALDRALSESCADSPSRKP
ncbi:chorismate mutase [Granulicella sp. L60]|jgi:chorismate mutase|uniref:chorismate mutase n=1 Tax=Granulicella sp. L60 TaxID=1641866 RepID=UPI00131ED039|nr:chorismate mutase [Granulicella sp. L60]